MCSQPRTRAFRKLITLLKPGGCMAITLRHGPAEPERGIHAASQAEIEHPSLRARGLSSKRRTLELLPLFEDQTIELHQP